MLNPSYHELKETKKCNISFIRNAYQVAGVVHVVPVEPHRAVVDPAPGPALVLIPVDVVVVDVGVRGAPRMAVGRAHRDAAVVQAAAISEDFNPFLHIHLQCQR